MQKDTLLGGKVILVGTRCLASTEVEDAEHRVPTKEMSISGGEFPADSKFAGALVIIAISAFARLAGRSGTMAGPI